IVVLTGACWSTPPRTHAGIQLRCSHGHIGVNGVLGGSSANPGLWGRILGFRFPSAALETKRNTISSDPADSQINWCSFDGPHSSLTAYDPALSYHFCHCEY